MRVPLHERSLVASLICAGALTFALPRLAAQVIVSHSGSIDPATEGWTLTTPVAGTVGAVTNDLGNGTAAWNVTDNSAINGYLYAFIPSGAQIAQGNAQGWTMSATMRLTTSAPSAGFVGFGYEDGTNAWNFYPQQTAGNDFVIAVVGGPTVNLTGQGNDYHTVSWVYTSGTARADLFVDGVARITNFAGAPNVGVELFFGGGASTGVGSANYSAVQFTAVPEPAASAAIFGALALVGLALRSRGIDRTKV